MVSWMAMLAVVVPGASTAVTLAMIPLAMLFAFAPAVRHLYDAESPMQMAVFSADVNAGPSSTARLWMLEPSNTIVHWMAAGSLPGGDCMERPIDAVPSALRVAVESTRQVCAFKPVAHRISGSHRRIKDSRTI